MRFENDLTSLSSFQAKGGKRNAFNMYLPGVYPFVMASLTCRIQYSDDMQGTCQPCERNVWGVLATLLLPQKSFVQKSFAQKSFAQKSFVQKSFVQKSFAQKSFALSADKA